jgi:hypothetical protein
MLLLLNKTHHLSSDLKSVLENNIGMLVVVNVLDHILTRTLKSLVNISRQKVWVNDMVRMLIADRKALGSKN